MDSFEEVALAYVQAVLETKQVDATTLARKSKLAPSTITRFIGAKGGGVTMRLSSLKKIEDWSKIPLPASLSRENIQQNAVPVFGIKPQGRNSVPIHVLIGSTRPDVYYRNPVATDFAPRFIGIEQASRVFALRMPDTTMMPWRRVNELVYVDPTRQVAEGDHALVEFGRASVPNDEPLHVIRQLLCRQGPDATLHGWNMQGACLQKGDRILSLKRILEWSELTLT
jgi:hypothetical protein